MNDNKNLNVYFYIILSITIIQVRKFSDGQQVTVIILKVFCIKYLIR